MERRSVGPGPVELGITRNTISLGEPLQRLRKTIEAARIPAAAALAASGDHEAATRVLGEAAGPTVRRQSR